MCIAVKCNDVKVIFVPQYDNLIIKDIVNFAKDCQEMNIYWPHDRDIPRIGRSWLCTMIHTVIGDKFR